MQPLRENYMLPYKNEIWHCAALCRAPPYRSFSGTRACTQRSPQRPQWQRRRPPRDRDFTGLKLFQPLLVHKRYEKRRILSTQQKGCMHERKNPSKMCNIWGKATRSLCTLCSQKVERRLQNLQLVNGRVRWFDDSSHDSPQCES